MNTKEPETAAVRVAGCTKQFRVSGKPIFAVRGIDLEIPRGQILALLGPNGAGKTTTLDMILGLTSPSSGTITVEGANPREAIRAGRVSAVLQTGGLLRDLTVAETVRMIASTFEDPMPVAEVMKQAGITGLASRKVSKCSGGEQQRLRFALALLPDPDLLILDEPTAGMDVTARREFWDTMRADAASGRTIIFATHYLEEADSFAERIVLMSGGRIVADGTTREIRERASGRIVSAQLDPATSDRAISHLKTLASVHSIEWSEPRVIVHATDSDAVALELLTTLGATGLEVSPGSLDQAFMALTSPVSADDAAQGGADAGGPSAQDGTTTQAGADSASLEGDLQ